MKSKHDDKSGGKQKQLKGNAPEAARNVEDKGKGDGAVGSREKELAKLAQRKK